MHVGMKSRHACCRSGAIVGQHHYRRNRQQHQNRQQQHLQYLHHQHQRHQYQHTNITVLPKQGNMYGVNMSR